MVSSKKITHADGVHPEEACIQLGVHLRTIFRWLKKGHLQSVNQTTLVKKTSLSETVALFKASCTTLEASRKLNAPTRTIQYFKNKGTLQKITVCGEERITLTSVEMVVKRGKYKRRKTTKKLLLYKTKNRKESGEIGTRKLVTLEAASRFTGLPIDSLIGYGFRTFETSKQVLVFASSILPNA